MSPVQLEAALNSLSPCLENGNTTLDKEIVSNKLGVNDNRNNEIRANTLITKEEQRALIESYREYMEQYVQEHTETKSS